MAEIIDITTRLGGPKRFTANVSRAKKIEAEIRLDRRKEVSLYHANKRRAAKLQRTPQWADEDAIRSIYDECAKTSKRTGIKHHVDHVVPLNGKNVCGLHVASNLQIIPAIENLRKRNKWVDEFPSA